MKYLVFLLLFSIVGCATSKKNKTSRIDHDGEDSIDIPEWVYGASDYCENKNMICASAEGDSFTAADLNAKKSLASIFETQVKSHFEMDQHDYSTSEVHELVERVRDSISESVDMVLKGAQILERHQKDNLFFALASLDKSQATKSLRREISLRDDQLNYLFNEGKRSSILKMHLLFDQREILNQKYLIMTNSSVPSEFSFSKINTLKFKNKEGNRIKIKDINTVPRTMHQWLEGLFTEMGYVVTPESNVDYLIKIKYFAKEEYLKVKGFKKFTFSLEAEAKNNAGDIEGSVTSQSTSTGRNEQDAFLKVKEKLKEDFKSNIDKLNIQ